MNINNKDDILEENQERTINFSVQLELPEPEFEEIT